MEKVAKIKFITMLLGIFFVCGQVFAAEDNTEYSGVYNDRQLIPNRMAELCQKQAEEMVQNPSSLVDCINTLAIKRRSTDAEVSREGLKELSEVKAEQIIKTMTFATIKGAEIAGYYDEGSKEVKETNEGAKTNNDSDAAAINTSVVLTSVVNSMRDLYVEQLKYLAISNIEEIKKETLDDIAELEKTKDDETKDDKKDNKSDEDKSSAEASNTVASVTTKTPATGLSYKGKGVCERCIKKDDGGVECNQEDCPPLRYVEVNEENVFYDCKYVDENNPEKGTKCERVEGK
jgi:hypothetical protein